MKQPGNIIRGQIIDRSIGPAAAFAGLTERRPDDVRARLSHRLAAAS